MIDVAVLGYGTVGSGVVEVLDKNADVIARNVGDEVRVAAILDLRDFPGDPFEDKVVHDFDLIVNDPHISVVCETMGGVGAAYNFTKQALLAGKSVCTSNKELVALHGPELLKIAKEHNCSYKFEASVGGGIPIIRPLQDAVTGDRILSVMGIVNGTTNYMLTKMEKDGAAFEEVLKEAQQLGYAELHPEADVEGFDAARKIAILASLVCGKTVSFEDIPTEGITGLSSEDVYYARANGYKIKLIARFEDAESGSYAQVAPFFVSPESPLYNVDDVFNAISVTGNMLGEAMFYGRGAGKLPTASAVVGDVVECAKNVGHNIPCNWQDENVKLSGFDSSAKSFFVRVKAADKEKAQAAFKVSSEWNCGFAKEFAFATSKMTEGEFKSACEGLDVINYLRFL